MRFTRRLERIEAMRPKQPAPWRMTARFNSDLARIYGTGDDATDYTWIGEPMDMAQVNEAIARVYADDLAAID